MVGTNQRRRTGRGNGVVRRRAGRVRATEAAAEHDHLHLNHHDFDHHVDDDFDNHNLDDDDGSTTHDDDDRPVATSLGWFRHLMAAVLTNFADEARVCDRRREQWLGLLR